MKFEISHKNYLPQRMTLYAGALGLLLTVIYGSFDYYQLFTSRQSTAIVEEISWSGLPYIGAKTITFKPSNQSRSFTIISNRIPGNINRGDSIKVLYDSASDYSVYNPFELFIVTPMLFFVFIFVISRSSKRKNVEI